MKRDNIYHAIEVNEDCYLHDETLNKLKNILSDQYLYSRRLQGDLDLGKGGFAGFDYISFYDNFLRYAKPYENNKFYRGYNSYSSYVANSLSLGFKRDDIEIIKPTLIAPVVFDWDSMEMMRILGKSDTCRYSDMPDEIQVKDKVSLKNLVCLTLPVHLMVQNKKGIIYDSSDIYDCVNDIKNLLMKYDYEVPVYDLYSRTKLDSEEKINKVFKKYKS